MADVSDKMREALERLRLEASRIERDQHKYAELAYSPTADVLESIADDIETALAEQPAQGEAVAWIHGDEYGDTCHWFGGSMPTAGTKLYTAPPAPSVPEGWKLVPVEPTIEMRVAYNVACETESGEDESWLVNAGYTAMLAAAPKVNP